MAAGIEKSDILQKIWSFLPYTDLLNSRRVSRAWSEAILNSDGFQERTLRVMSKEQLHQLKDSGGGAPLWQKSGVKLDKWFGFLGQAQSQEPMSSHSFRKTLSSVTRLLLHECSIEARALEEVFFKLESLQEFQIRTSRITFEKTHVPGSSRSISASSSATSTIRCNSLQELDIRMSLVDIIYLARLLLPSLGTLASIHIEELPHRHLDPKMRALEEEQSEHEDFYGFDGAQARNHATAMHGLDFGVFNDDDFAPDPQPFHNINPLMNAFFDLVNNNQPQQGQQPQAPEPEQNIAADEAIVQVGAPLNEFEPEPEPEPAAELNNHPAAPQNEDGNQIIEDMEVDLQLPVEQPAAQDVAVGPDVAGGFNFDEELALGLMNMEIEDELELNQDVEGTGGGDPTLQHKHAAMQASVLSLRHIIKEAIIRNKGTLKHLKLSFDPTSYKHGQHEAISFPALQDFIDTLATNGVQLRSLSMTGFSTRFSDHVSRLATWTPAFQDSFSIFFGSQKNLKTLELELTGCADHTENQIYNFIPVNVESLKIWPSNTSCNQLNLQRVLQLKHLEVPVDNARLVGVETPVEDVWMRTVVMESGTAMLLTPPKSYPEMRSFVGRGHFKAVDLNALSAAAPHLTKLNLSFLHYNDPEFTKVFMNIIIEGLPLLSKLSIRLEKDAMSEAAITGYSSMEMEEMKSTPDYPNCLTILSTARSGRCLSDLKHLRSFRVQGIHPLSDFGLYYGFCPTQLSTLHLDPKFTHHLISDWGLEKLGSSLGPRLQELHLQLGQRVSRPVMETFVGKLVQLNCRKSTIIHTARERILRNVGEYEHEESYY